MEVFLESLRNSGKEFLSAKVVTNSEGRIPGRMVLIHEPNDFQIVVGTVNDKC